jgi:ferredoxin-thioredoxin reductase catalytic chain
MKHEEAVKESWRIVENYAEKKGYRLNPDSEHVKGLIEEMARNHVEFGARYCPCMTKRITGDKRKDAKRICPCIWHKEDIEKFRICYCGLFVALEFDPSKHKGVPPSEWGKYD